MYWCVTGAGRHPAVGAEGGKGRAGGEDRHGGRARWRATIRAAHRQQAELAPDAATWRGAGPAGQVLGRVAQGQGGHRPITVVA
eukprot:6500641-Pyramimonas_sp.AAC.1